MWRAPRLLLIPSTIFAVFIAGCVGPAGNDGESGQQGLQGEPGEPGEPGDPGTPGADGQPCTVVDNLDGTKTITCPGNVSVVVRDGTTGTPGTNGTNGTPGEDGTDCTVTDNPDGTHTISCTDGTEVVVTNGNDGGGYLPKIATGLVGYVKDTAEAPVVGATVYLVKNTDIPVDEIDTTTVVLARASTVDEPLEDTIVAHGATYAQGVTDAQGVYRIPVVAAGRYFLVAIPAADDDAHLPGGSRCRTAIDHTELLGAQVDIAVSTRPSNTAEYVGPSVCLNCHGMVHESQTLHMLGIREVGRAGPLQDSSRFPAWNDVLKNKFTVAGTTLYFYGYDATAVSWKVSETNPGTGVSFTMLLASDGNGHYTVDLTNVAGAAQTVHYPVDISYGGGLYKQRFTVNIGGSRYVLPIQYNFQGQVVETGKPSSRWTWVHYNAQNWYDETNKALKTPAKTKSFDNNCAGCHFTGIELTGDATLGWQAHGIPDRQGEMDYDGDGQDEMMNISCESCHGPGSEHWERAGKGRAIVSPRLLTPEREVTICASCHTRANGVGGGATEAPLDAAGHMPRAGISRAEFLTNHVSKIDDGFWDLVKGDGDHSIKHHQQVSDFIKSAKYRNPDMLVTCASCHDLHGKSDNTHQIRAPLDSADGGAGLCMSCHDKTYPAGNTLGKRIQTHYASKGIADMAMGDIQCVQCHMPKTAKSGSGTAEATIAGVTYYHGDISSHVFDVPRRASIATKDAQMMAIAYTNACGACHFAAP